MKIASRQAYLDELTLDVDDVSAIACLPPEFIENLHQEMDVLDGALVGNRLRPYAVAILCLVVELGELRRDGRLTEGQTIQAFQELSPTLRETFDGLVTRRFDFSRLRISTNTEPRVELTFMQEAVAHFLAWATGIKIT